MQQGRDAGQRDADKEWIEEDATCRYCGRRCRVGSALVNEQFCRSGLGGNCIYLMDELGGDWAGGLRSIAERLEALQSRAVYIAGTRDDHSRETHHLLRRLPRRESYATRYFCLLQSRAI
jgi:hypothetical protein